MHNNGLTKLMEECGELAQIAAKKSAYYATDIHPDGKGSMKERLENEMGDVIAASLFVAEKYDLDIDRIIEQANKKYNRFKVWDTEE